MSTAKEEGGALAAARREMERIGRELEGASREVEEPVPLKDSSRTDPTRIFSSDSEASDLDAELGMELDQVLGSDDFLDESPLERILESFDSGDRGRTVEALAWVRAEPPESLKLHATCLEGPLAKLRQSSDRVIAQAARAARLRLFAATKSDAAAPNAAELTQRDLEAQLRKLRRTLHESTQAWQKEKALLNEEIGRAQAKTNQALALAKKTADAARADNVRFQREINALKLKLRQQSTTEKKVLSADAESPSAFLRLRRSPPPSSSPHNKRPKQPSSTADETNKLPACRRMVRPRTSGVSSPTPAASSPSAAVSR